jgi:hypothetical protein
VERWDRRIEAVAEAEAVLRAVHEHSVEEPIERIASLIHPDAEMRLLVSYGELVRGRDAIARALQHGREATTFRAQVQGFEWLDETTSLTTASARYPLRAGGFGEGRVFWLDELRDGMVWRIRVFRREQDARATHRDGLDISTGGDGKDANGGDAGG